MSTSFIQASSKAQSARAAAAVNKFNTSAAFSKRPSLRQSQRIMLIMGSSAQVARGGYGNGCCCEFQVELVRHSENSHSVKADKDGGEQITIIAAVQSMFLSSQTEDFKVTCSGLIPWEHCPAIAKGLANPSVDGSSNCTFNVLATSVVHFM